MPPNDDDGFVAPGAPPPPDDRLWRHPSELGWADAHAGRRRRVIVAAGVVAVVALGALTVAAVTAIEPSAPRSGERAGGAAGTSGLRFDPSVGAIATAVRSARESVATVDAIGSTGRASGGAVVFDSNGLLVTTARLVADAETVRVSVGGETYAAVVVAVDPDFDLALLEIRDGTGLRPAVIGGHAEGGDTAVVVAPDVDADAEMVTVEEEHATATTPDGVTIYGLISVSGLDDVVPGHLLVDRSGRVVGLMAGPRDDGTGAYALPGELVAAVADDLAADGRPQRVLLGIEGRDLNAAERAAFGVDAGTYVARVVPGTPAEAAGVLDGDVIIAVDGAPVTNTSALLLALRLHEPGDRVRVLVARDGERISLNAVLAERPG